MIRNHKSGMKKTQVAILGATGAIGQQFVSCLENHPQLEVTTIMSSTENVGKNYVDAVNGTWYPDFKGGMPEYIKHIKISAMDPVIAKKNGVEIAFSALPGDVSKNIEPEFARNGMIVISKSSSFRRSNDVPLLIPEVNPDHLKLLEIQRKNRGWEGAIVADPNCTTSGLALSLKPILDTVGIKRVIVVTAQAMSGAGYLGLSPIAITNNMLPNIKDEEDKTENEPKKILGKFVDSQIEEAKFKVSTICNRVPVDYGHMEFISIETEESPDIEDIKESFRKFKGLPQDLGLHSAPDNPIIVRDEENRPQPKLDVNAGNGMSITIGRVRKEPVFKNGIKYALLVHNTIRGGAGMAVLNAELILALQSQYGRNISMLSNKI